MNAKLVQEEAIEERYKLHPKTVVAMLENMRFQRAGPDSQGYTCFRIDESTLQAFISSVSSLTVPNFDNL